MRSALALAAVALAGCGGGGGASSPRTPAVIRAWADAVRHGDIDAATRLFALPATVANGEPSRRLTTRAAVDAFNRGLPCGAVLLDTQPAAGGYVLATFELVEGAAGSPCAGRARVSFRIRDGRITAWLRESDGPPPGATEI